MVVLVPMELTYECEVLGSTPSKQWCLGCRIGVNDMWLETILEINATSLTSSQPVDDAVEVD